MSVIRHLETHTQKKRNINIYYHYRKSYDYAVMCLLVVVFSGKFIVRDTASPHSSAYACGSAHHK